MKTINILLVLLMTFSFAANAHGDKNKCKGLFKGIDTPAAKVVLAFHQALETGNQKQARAQLVDDGIPVHDAIYSREVIDYNLFEKTVLNTTGFDVKIEG